MLEKPNGHGHENWREDQHRRCHVHERSNEQQHQIDDQQNDNWVVRKCQQYPADRLWDKLVRQNPAHGLTCPDQQENDRSDNPRLQTDARQR